MALSKSALLVTDVTNCFGPKPTAELPVPKSKRAARQTVRNINRLIKHAEKNLEEWACVILSRDWHDPDSPHFNKWPVHGVKFTNGSGFYPGLKIRSTKIPIVIVSKGLGKVDGYSPFDPIPDVNIVLVMPNGNVYLWDGDLNSLLWKHFNVSDIYNTGWARNYCVDAGNMAGLELGYRMHLVTDASDGVDVPTDPENHIERSDERMANAGVKFFTTDEVINEVY